MSTQLTHGQSVSGGGLSIQASVSRTGSGSIALSDTVVAAKSGTLTTRTDNNTGTLTMASGHGFTDGQIIDIYWDGGVQYGVVIGTVSVNSVPIDSGIGDNLPSASTAITAALRTTANVYIDGDNTKLIAVLLSTLDRTIATAGHAEFYDAADDLIAELDLVTNVPRVFDIEGGATNPFTGDPITYVKLSQANTSATETYAVTVIGVYDASP